VVASVIFFLLCAAGIYCACEYFVNGIEWVGRRLKLGDATIGTVLAAFGTALPESAVTFAAVVFGRTEAQKEIGVGAAVGGPLVLATISYAVVGVVLFLSRRRLGREDMALRIDSLRLSRDQTWFGLIFLVSIVLGLTQFHGKNLFGVALFAAYGLYVWGEMRNDTGEGAHARLEPLKIRPRDADPSLAWAALQTAAALAVIGVASRLFVMQLETIGAGLGLSTQFVALLLSPVATELPETLNAVIWVRQGRERLALANISGAMMIQATVPAGLGVLFTAWRFDAPLIVAGLVTILAVAVLWSMFRRRTVSGLRLVPMGLLYLVFVAAVIVLRTYGDK
jgi:cation:H+ antiporter